MHYIFLGGLDIYLWCGLCENVENLTCPALQISKIDVELENSDRQIV